MPLIYEPTPAQLDDMKATIKNFKKMADMHPECEAEIAKDKISITVMVDDVSSIITMRDPMIFARTDFYKGLEIEKNFGMRSDFVRILDELVHLQADCLEEETFLRDIQTTLRQTFELLKNTKFHVSMSNDLILSMKYDEFEWRAILKEKRWLEVSVFDNHEMVSGCWPTYSFPKKANELADLLTQGFLNFLSLYISSDTIDELRTNPGTHKRTHHSDEDQRHENIRRALASLDAWLDEDDED